MMELYYLILALSNSSVIIPTPYTKDQCFTLQKEWTNSKNKGMAYCVQAPKIKPDTLTEMDKRWPDMAICYKDKCAIPKE
jgi:hypothetical protein